MSESIGRQEVELFVAVLLDQVYGQNDSIDLNLEYYWSVPPSAAGDVGAPPPELGIGDLADDLKALRRLVSEPELRIGYGLVWLGEIFKALGRAYPG